MEKIHSGKKNWVGHVLRGEGMLKEVLEGRMKGKKPRGKPRTKMLNELINRTYKKEEKKDGTYGYLKRKAKNRKEWRGWKPWTEPAVRFGRYKTKPLAPGGLTDRCMRIRTSTAWQNT